MSEINPEHARAWNRWKGTAIEWLAVIIACYALLSGMVNNAISRQNSANAHAVAELARAEFERSNDKVDILEVRYTNLLGYLKANNIHIPERFEE